MESHASDPGTNAAHQLTRLIQGGERATQLNLRGADLSDRSLATLRGDRLNLQGVDFSSSDLSGAQLTQCQLEGANLADADFSAAVLQMCCLDRVRAPRLRFEDGRLEDGSAVGADLEGAVLRRCQLNEMVFARACLQGAVLEGAEGDGVEFRGADLRNISLVKAQMTDADFRGADLRGANLSGGSFDHADFRGALTEGAIWDGASVAEAQFDDDSSVRSQSSAKTPKSNEQPAAALENLFDVINDLGSRVTGDDASTRRLFELLQKLSVDSDEPPEELRSWLEPLMGATQQGGRPDIAMVIQSAMEMMRTGKSDAPSQQG